MRKGGSTFPGPGPGRRSTVGRSGASALDEAFDSVLGGSEEGRTHGGASKQGRGSRSQTRGKSPLTSSATDNDFYSSLAQMAGDSFDDPEDDEPSITEEDAKRMAHSLADMDDLESDLFGGSLGKKKTPSKSAPTTPNKQLGREGKDARGADTSTPKKLDQSTTAAQEKTPSGPAKTSQDTPSARKPVRKPKKKFDFGEFDEDDPLAGLLSDEDDEPKPKKTPTRRSQPPKASGSSEKQESGRAAPATADTERPSTSRGRRTPAGEAAPSPDSTEKTPADRGELSTGKSPSSPTRSASSAAISPPGSAEKRGESRGSEVAAPSTPDKKMAGRRPKDEINFDSDEDLPGLDDSLNQSPAGQAPEAAKESAPTATKRKGARRPGADADMFGGDDGLAGLDDARQSSGKAAAERDRSASRFDQLLGKKDKDAPGATKAVPRSLDDFMSNISSSSSSSSKGTPKGGGAPDKKVSSPTSEESFQFGGYMPSAASSGPGRARGLSRPDTAPGPGRRAVRFADELGLGGEDGGRPATAPNERTPLTRGRRAGESRGGSFLDESPRDPGARSEESSRAKGKDDLTPTSSKNATQAPAPGGDTPKEPAQSGSSGSDWLGLGGDDKGLELDFSLSKSTAQAPDVKIGGQQVPTPEQERPAARSPRRLGRRADQKNGDEFLRMLGITPDEPSAEPSAQPPEPADNRTAVPWEGSADTRRRVRGRDQITGQEDPLGLPSSTPQQGGPLGNGQDAPFSTSENETRRGGDGMNAQRLSQEQQPEKQPLPWEQPSAKAKAPSREGRALMGNEKTGPSQPPPSQAQFAQQPPSHHALPHGQPPPQPSPHMNQPTQPQTPSAQPYAQLQTPHTYMMPQHPPPQSLPSPYLPASPYPAQGVVDRLKLEVRTAEQEMAAELYELDKARLEGEVRGLMKRVQQTEEDRKRHEVDTSGRVAELEAQVRRLELERDHLSSSLEMSGQRHRDELSSLENSHRAHIKTIEESFARRQERLREETELLIAQHNEKLRALDQEKADIQASTSRKVGIVETAKNTEIERLKDAHRRAADQLRQEHEEEMQQLRRLKEQEVAAATSAHAHTKSLQSLMQQVLNSTKEVSDMRHQVEVTHRGGLEEREMAARARDEYLKQLQERSLRQQAENDEERARLQGLIAKMEINIREQTRQTEQERWKLAQQEARHKALQASLEEERRVTMETLGAERADVQRARQELLQEQMRVTTSLQEERRALAMERAQITSTQREIVSREKHKTDSNMQAEANLEVTAARIKEDTAGLAAREARTKQEEERLDREKRELTRDKSAFEEERDRVGRLGLEVRQRSQEIEELCTAAARAREEGELALGLAEQIRNDGELAREDAETRLLMLQEKEKQLAQDRLSIAQERRLLELDRQAGRCWQCTDTRAATPAPPTRQTGALSLETPVSRPHGDPVVLPISPAAHAPDLLVESLELRRTLRKWTEDKEKDDEFLEQEAMFLDKLHRTRKNATRSRPLNESAAY